MPVYPILVQGNTAPVIKATLTHKDGSALNLTECHVYIQMRKADDKHFTVNAEATVATAATGKVEYTLGANDLNISGEYHVQWKVVYATGKVQTTASPNTVTVRRE